MNGRNCRAEAGIRNNTPEKNHSAPAVLAASATRSNSPSPSVIPGISGDAETPTCNPASRNSFTALRRKSGRGARGLQQASQAGLQSGHSHVDGQRGFGRNDVEDIDVANDLIGLGDDRDAEAFALGQLLKAGTRDAVLPFRGLVGIGGRADSNVFGLRVAGPFRFVGVLLRDIARQQSRSILLDKNLALELAAINLHVLMGVARVTVFAGKFAAAVGIYRPFKGHAIGIAAIEDGFNGEEKVFRFFGGLAFAFRSRGLCSEASNAHQWRMGNLELRRGAIRRRAIQISLTPAGYALGKGTGL